jgi:broad specificity phosphatase PhoE/uncharacterized protein YerC
MAIGTSDGQYFEDEFAYQQARLPQSSPQPKPEDSNLYLVRHGDTDLNDENIVHGWTKQSLNDKGIEQAHKAAESLKDKDITHIVSSDLPRAKQTANIISKETGVPVTFDQNLRTWDAGDFDGTKKHDEFKRYAEAKEDVTPPGSSESFGQFKDRAINAISGIHANNPGNTVVVTHSKNIGVMDAWEHAGYPEDNSIHMSTYEDSRCRPTTGGHQKLEIPEHVDASFNQRFNGPAESWSNNADIFSQRFEGESQKLATTFPGEKFVAPEYNTLRDEIVRPRWPTDSSNDFLTTPYYPDADKRDQGYGQYDYQGKPSLENIADLKQQQPLEKGGGAGPSNTVIKGPGVPEVRPRGFWQNEGAEAIIKSHSEGKTTGELAQEFSISKDRVTRILKDLDLKPNPTKIHSDETIAKVKDLYNQGKSYKTIAEETGLNKDQISGLVNRNKTGEEQRNTSFPKEGEVKLYTPKPYEGLEANKESLYDPAQVVEWRDYMQAQVSKGLSVKDIAKTLRIPELDVQVFVNTHFKK